MGPVRGVWVKWVRADGVMDSGSDQNPQNGEKDAVKVEDKGKGGGGGLRLGEDSDCSL